MVLTTLLFASVLAKSAIIINQPIEKYVKKSELIVRGVVISKKAKNEAFHLKQHSMSNGKISTSRQMVKAIYTTFTIQINELLRGEYDTPTIEVKMLGGCEENGSCFRMSSHYQYEVSDEVLMFLNYDEVNDFFHSTSNGITAYLVSENDELMRAGDFMTLDNNGSIIPRKDHKHSLSVDELKQVIEANKNE